MRSYGGRMWQTARHALRENATARAFVLYVAAFALAGATPLLLLPVLTRMLTPAELGVATGFLVAALLIANVAGLSAHGLVAVRFFKMERSAFARLVGVALRAVLVSHVIVLALMWPAREWLEATFELPGSIWLLATLAALVLSLNQTFLAMFQIAGEPAGYLKSRALQSLTELTLCVVILLFLAQDERARVYSFVVAVALAAGYGLRFACRRGYIGAGGGRADLITVLRYGLPLLPHLMAGTGITYLDRVIVGATLGAKELGLYTAAAQIGLVMMLVIEPLNKALMPWLYAKLALNDAAVNLRVVRATYLSYVALALLGAIVAGAGVLFFDVIVGSQYHTAKMLVPLIVVGFVFQGMYYSVVNYVFYAEKTGHLSFVTSAVVIVGTLLSYTLVVQLGLLGAALAFAVNNLLLFLATWLLSMRAVNMPWGLRA